MTTRKCLTGNHTGPLLGVAPTGRSIIMQVISIVRVRAERYFEYWGPSTLPILLQQLVQLT